MLIKYFSTIMQGKRKLCECHTRFLFYAKTSIEKSYIKQKKTIKHIGKILQFENSVTIHLLIFQHILQ